MDNTSVEFQRFPEVRRRSGLSHSSIYAMISRGEFPKPVKLGARSVAWLDSEITGWISDRVQASRGGVQ